MKKLSPMTIDTSLILKLLFVGYHHSIQRRSSRRFIMTAAVLVATVGIGYSQHASISGTVVSEHQKESIEFSTVTIHNEADSALVTGVVTDANGKFEITNVPDGQYYAKVQFMGFVSKQIESIKISGRRNLNLGTITLIARQELLNEVVVTGQPATFIHKIDKQVYNTASFGSAQGGTAIEAVRNLPSVSLNGEGEITLRGSEGLVVLLNGKIIQSDPLIVLNQLPANSIQQIEVITTPSSKFDPDGKAGMINIVTKKGATDGYSITANVQQGLPSLQDYGNEKRPLRFGGDILSTLRHGRWDVSVSGNYKRDDIAGYREGLADTYLNGIHTSFPSLGERSYHNISYGFNAIATYQASPKDKFETGFYVGRKSQYRKANILYQQKRFGDNEMEELNSFDYFNKNLRERKGDFMVMNLDYQHSFLNSATLSFSGLYEKTTLGGPTSNSEANPLNEHEVYNRAYMQESNPLDGIRFKADYVVPITKQLKFETGYQYRYLLHRGDFIYNELDVANNTWKVREDLSSSVKLKRHIHAVYSQVSGQAKKISYATGLRLEYVDRSLKDNGTAATYTFRRLNVFPTANVTFDISEDFSAKAGYSRRITHNTSNMMNPFPARRHSEVLEIGDPNLLPEYTGITELGVTKHFSGNTIFLNVYHRRVKNVINRVNTLYNDTILYRTYTNAGIANAFGGEVGADLKLSRWWTLYAGLNVYNYSIEGTVYKADVSTSGVNYSFNMNSSFTIQPSLVLQLTVNYTSRTVTAQGEDSRFIVPTLSVKKNIFEGQGSVSLQWQNIDMGLLGSNEQKITTAGVGFFSSTNYIYEVDVFRLNFAFNFNKLAKKMKFAESEFGEKEF